MMSISNDKDNNSLDIGFIFEKEPLLLKSKYFPSKVGGKPAWLSLGNNIPTSKTTLCEYCNSERVFLVQIYAILDKKNCFHRTLYVFACKSEKCNSGNKNGSFLVLRSQLDRENEFYSYHPPNYDSFDNITDDGPIQNVCNVCGMYATKKCNSCSQMFYCSKEHQRLDWTPGHKKECKDKIIDYARGNIIISLFYIYL